MMQEVQLILTVGNNTYATYSVTSWYDAGNSIDGWLVPGNLSLPVGSVIIINQGSNVYSGAISYIEYNYDDDNTYVELITGGSGVNGVSATLQYILTVAGEYIIDLYENESISQNWKFTDINQLSATGSFSREFRIPASKTNLEFFGPLYDVNYGSLNDFYNRRIVAEIRINTATIAKGYLRVLKTFLQLNKIADFQVNFYSESPNLVSVIGDKKLKDIVALSDLEQEVNYTNINAALSDCSWFLTDRGQKWQNTTNISTNNVEGIRPITNSNYPVYPADMTPAIKWSWIFDKIITEAGFTYEATDLLNILGGYWMPFLNSARINRPEAYLGNYNFQAYLSSNINLLTSSSLSPTSEAYDINGDYVAGATSIYTAPITADYSFNVKYSYSYLADNSLCGTQTLKIYVVNITQGVDYVAGTVNIPTASAFTSSNNNIVTPLLTIQQGDQIRIKFVMFYQAGNCATTNEGPSTVTILSTGSGTGWGLNTINAENYGFDFLPSLNAPDMKQIDFIKDVCNMHNLAVVPNKTFPNKIQFIPMDLYLNSGAEDDWTFKLNVQKDIVISPTADYQKSRLSFTYSAGQDVYSKTYVELGRIYGDYVLDGYTVSENETPSDFATGSLEVKLITQSTPCVDIPGLANSATAKFINETGEFVNPGARVLFHSGSINGVMYNDGTNTVSTVTLRLLNHYSATVATVNDYDLNFAPEVPLHSIESNPYNNLFNLYWRSYLNGIYSSQSRIMEAFFDLELTDILSFDFNNYYWIKDSYWRVLEISDYKIGLKESTKVVLMKVIASVRDCSVIPVSNELTGVINWEDAEGNPTDGNQTCCNRYGYIWSEQQNLCFGTVDQFVSNPSEFVIYPRVIPGQGGNNVLPDVGVFSGNNLNVNVANVNSVVAGNLITLDAGNANSVAIGNKIRLTGSNGGAALFGKNVSAKYGGMYYGGGWAGNDLTGVEGAQQYGVLLYSTIGNFAATGDEEELFIEGISGNRLTLDNDTYLSCIFMLVVTDGTYTGYKNYTFMITRDSLGVARVTGLNLVGGADSSIAVDCALTIDTTTIAGTHILNVVATGTGFPFNNASIVGTLQFTQLAI